MSPVLARPLTAMRSAALREWPWYPVLIAGSIVLQPLADLPLQLGAGLRPLLIALAIGLLMTLAWVRSWVAVAGARLRRSRSWP